MIYYRFILLCLVVAALLGGCTSTKPLSGKTWHDQLPPKQYFIDYYNAHSNKPESYSIDEYLMWVERFYLGWELFSRGWLKATDELVATLEDPGEQAQAKQLSFDLGKIVSAEWALENDIRKVNSQHLSIWGNALMESMTRQEQLLMLNKILADAKAVVNESLPAKEFHSERYYAQGVFGNDFE